MVKTEEGSEALRQQQIDRIQLILDDLFHRMVVGPDDKFEDKVKWNVLAAWGNTYAKMSAELTKMMGWASSTFAFETALAPGIVQTQNMLAELLEKLREPCPFCGKSREEAETDAIGETETPVD
jgi:hypothetical protein